MTSHQHDEVVKYLQSVVNLDHVLRCLDSQRQRDRNVSTVGRMLDRVRRLTSQFKNVRHGGENRLCKAIRVAANRFERVLPRKLVIRLERLQQRVRIRINRHRITV